MRTACRTSRYEHSKRQGPSVPGAKLILSLLTHDLAQPQILISTDVTYSTTIAAIRISVLLLYRRIFDVRRFRLATYVVGGLTIAWWLAAVMVAIFQCHPVKDAWSPLMGFTKNCINFGAFWYGIAGSNLILEIVTLVMPLYLVWSLQLAPSQKLLLSGIFCIGGL